MKMKSVSFAVLGQLAFRPWAAYELIKEMQRNFHYFFPRAESGLYEELKKLEKLGLVHSVMEFKGKKGRAVYSITEEGRIALKDWLNTEPDQFWLEFDGLLRLFLSKFGERAMLDQALTKVANDSEALIKLAETVGNEYLNDRAPAQAEILDRACVFDFLLHYGILYREWLARTKAYYETVDGMLPVDATNQAKLAIKKNLQKFQLEVKMPTT